MVSCRMKETRGEALKHPRQVLEMLKKGGHCWTVVQSLHLIGGHEFYRLLQDIQACPIRAAVGLPLLSTPADYNAVLDHLTPLVEKVPDEAVILVGHGTDHPSWTAYAALDLMCRNRFGDRVMAATIEGGYPDCSHTINRVLTAGFKKVRLVPLLLVAGVHFQEDLAGKKDSWAAAFRHHGITVALHPDGLGMEKSVIDIFCRHIRDALDVIPDSAVMTSPHI